MHGCYQLVAAGNFHLTCTDLLSTMKDLGDGAQPIASASSSYDAYARADGQLKNPATVEGTRTGSVRQRKYDTAVSPINSI
jgi:hypothetical protein